MRNMINVILYHTYTQFNQVYSIIYCIKTKRRMENALARLCKASKNFVSMM